MAATGRRDDGFLIAPAVDLALLIGSPLWALVVARAIASSTTLVTPVEVLGAAVAPAELAIATLIAAHFLATFARSHADPEVRARHPGRFLIAPPLLLGLLATSAWARALAAALAVVWDVHHSSMQTFGLARLYERAAGNDGRSGRSADLLLNHLLYAGPVLAGIGFLDHVNGLHHLTRVGPVLFADLTADARALRPTLAMAVLVVGGPVLAAWAVVQVRLVRAGQAVSWQRLGLLGATGLCSIVSWGLDPFGQALLTMKLFHVVQYFTLIAWTGRVRLGSWWRRSRPSLAAILAATLLHFWYDGFIWSARRGVA